VWTGFEFLLYKEVFTLQNHPAGRIQPRNGPVLARGRYVWHPWYRPFSQKGRSTVDRARWRHKALLRGAPHLRLALGPAPARTGPAWTYANNSGRNLDWRKIRFSYLRYILQYNFWIGFESEKLKSLHLEKTLKVTVWGPLIQWKHSLKSTSVQVWDTWSLKCSMAWLDSQNRKFAPILIIITEAKNAH